MIRVCAWCRAILGYKCDHCGGDLIPADLVRLGYRKRLKHERVLICPAANEPYVFTLDTHQQITHGICDTCASLSSDEKDALARKNRARFTDKVSSQVKPTDVTSILKKRGPTGVTSSATPPAPEGPHELSDHDEENE